MAQRFTDAMDEVQQEIAEFILVEPFRVLAEMLGGSSSSSSSGPSPKEENRDSHSSGGCTCCSWFCRCR